jgi:hypothetical protein
MLEHVLVDEVVQLDWNMLQLCRLNWWVLRNVLRPYWQELPLAAFRQPRKQQVILPFSRYIQVFSGHALFGKSAAA